MDSMTARKARVVLQRFGLGPKPGGMARIASDPVGALRREIETAGVAAIVDPDLPTRSEACRRSQRGFASAEKVRALEIKARIAKHLSVEIGFVERLVLFWSNHFSMTVNKDEAVRGTIGQLERDVIRAEALGRFDRMIRGVMRHPAMIRYLDNQDSKGPNSKIGKAWGQGLNENLGREILELHTLGSGGGYGEADVTAMAKILTGRSYVRGWEADNGWNGGTPQNRGHFIFRADWHEPGPIRLMGRTFDGDGLTQGDDAIKFIATRPATAQHIAFKLCRHFIADEPTATMVEPVARAFLESQGDLKKTALALIALPEAWSLPLTKVRTPYELAVAQYRALGVGYPEDRSWAFTEPLRALRHLPWERGSPDGYPDENGAWLDPDGMTIRLDTAMLTVDLFGAAWKLDARRLGLALYNRLLTEETLAALNALPSKRDGLTLLFMTPEFQRR